MEDQKKKEYDEQPAVSYLKLNWLHRQGSIPEQLLQWTEKMSGSQDLLQGA